MSARNTVVLTTCRKSAPADCSSARMFSITRVACSVMSPVSICPVAGSIGIDPDRYTMLPTLMAGE